MTLYIILLILVDLCADVTCVVTGETCEGGICKCGTADTCENQATGEICDATNNRCKCTDTVDSCTGVETCNGVACGV